MKNFFQEGKAMASVVIRNLSEATHNAIKFRARAAGRSTEAEIRLILDNIAKAQQTVRLGSMLASIGQEIGGVELEDVRGRNTDNEVSL
ncbi:antitoxin [Neisseria gonorrhoeae NYC_2011_05_13]|nr:trafficking protein A [Neisseria gonorrhoeae NCCP11945]APW53090.1 antitoxin [Neisseria gonorrhoeae NG-k51.05]KLS59022.1 antitoxin [Neisseria gonorrhoeae NYC_2011_05_13]KLS68190.1 antitoxin [Neisseria gonorrhoeae NOR_2011_03-06]KLS83717.1 antitoxin [Neisseria gonorrhoeae MU_NG21]KLS89779.1 antitoxin [Neisseria gonorrhoeae MU_NG14]KLT04322.1 antitoxin [Neisseria gonorrhoeae MU_NG25]